MTDGPTIGTASVKIVADVDDASYNSALNQFEKLASESQAQINQINFEAVTGQLSEGLSAASQLALGMKEVDEASKSAMQSISVGTAEIHKQVDAMNQLGEVKTFTELARQTLEKPIVLELDDQSIEQLKSKLSSLTTRMSIEIQNVQNQMLKGLSLEDAGQLEGEFREHFGGAIDEIKLKIHDLQSEPLSDAGIDQAFIDTADAAKRAGREVLGFRENLETVQTMPKGGMVNQFIELRENMNLARTEAVRFANTSSRTLTEAGFSTEEMLDSGIVKEFTKAANEAEEAIEGLASKLVTRLTVATVGLATAAFYAFTQYERAAVDLFNRLPELSDAAATEMIADMRSLSDEIEVGYQDTLGAAAMATRLGVDPDQFGDLARDVSDLATVSGSLTSAVSTVTFALNTFGEEAGNAQEVSGKLWVAMRDGGVELDQASKVIARLAPITRQAGVSFDELLAIVTKSGQSMIPATQVMTAMIRMIAKLQDPTDKIAAAYRSLGVESLPQAIQKFGSLTGVLNQLRVYAEQNGVAFDDLIGGFYSVQVAMALVADEGAGVSEIMESMATGADEVAGASEKIQGTAGFAIQRFREELQETLVLLGAGVAQLVKPLLGVFETLAEVFNKNALVLKILGNALAVLAVSFAVNKFVAWVRGFDAIAKAVVILAQKVGLLTVANKAAEVQARQTAVAMNEMGKASTGLISGIGAGIGIALVGFQQIRSMMDEYRAQIEADIDAIIDKFYELNELGESGPKSNLRESLREIIQSRLIDEGTLKLLTDLGYSTLDVADSIIDGSDAVSLAIERAQTFDIREWYEKGYGSRDFTNLILDIAKSKKAFNRLADDQLAELTDIWKTTGELPDIDVLDALGIPKESEIYKAASTLLEDIFSPADIQQFRERAEMVEEIVNSIAENTGVEVSPLLAETLASTFRDLDDAVDLFAQIEATAASKIDSLINTIFTRPIEQANLSKGDFARVFADNARAIEEWQNVIDYFTEQGQVRLAQKVAEMGPEYVNAWKDVARDPELANAFEGSINDMMGGFTPEEISGTFGSLWEYLAEDQNLSENAKRYGEEAFASMIQGSVDWSNSQEAHEMLTSAIEGTWLPALVTTNEQAVETTTQGGENAAVGYVTGLVQVVNNSLQTLYNTGFLATSTVVAGGAAGMQVRSPSKKGMEQGSDYIKGIWMGVIDEAATAETKAKAVGKSIGDAVGEGLDESIQDQTRKLGNAFKTILNAEDMQIRIDDQIAKINSLAADIEVNIPAEIADTQEAIAAEKLVGGEGVVTATEQVGIEAAEKNLKDMILAEKQGFVSKAAVQKAQDELNQAINDSVAPSQELINLEEDLVDLNEELARTEEELADAIRDLDRLFIDAALGMIDVAEALYDIDNASPEALQMFEDLAAAAGIPKAAFDAMTANVRTNMEVFRESIEQEGIVINFEPGDNATSGGGGGGGGGGISPVILDPDDIEVDVDANAGDYVTGNPSTDNLRLKMALWEQAIIEAGGKPGHGVIDDQGTFRIKLKSKQVQPIEVKYWTHGYDAIITTRGGDWGVVPQNVGVQTTALGGMIDIGELSLVGERGPELIQGPASVVSTAETANILQELRGKKGGEYNITIPVSVGFPISGEEQRNLAGVIRDAIYELEYEDS